jgi:hypothetical protein
MMEGGKRKPEVKKETSEVKRRRRDQDDEDQQDRAEEHHPENHHLPPGNRQDSTETDENGDAEEDSNIFEAGMILKVHMENFMCHNKFTVTLGRMLNFLTGANGSG